jgi:outer membrane protein assembly factor BamE (lipoprotein component of BamABCDE complex)
MKKLWIVWLMIGFSVAGYLFWCYAHTESYCFFYPSIDTRYAPGFSEQVFNSITTGMTAEAVQAKLGSPLHVQPQPGGDLWFYTLDGKCKWGDWAWLCRLVNIRDGQVNEIVSETIYN